VLVRTDSTSLSEARIPERDHHKVKYVLLYPNRKAPTLQNTKVVGWIKGCVVFSETHTNYHRDLQRDEHTDEILLDPTQFVENDEFEKFLQQVISKHIYHCPASKTRAGELKSGTTAIFSF
jgi:hypothetical protein